MGGLQAQLSKVEQLKAELESARKYNNSLVNERTEEKKKSVEAISAFEMKVLELERAKKEKVDVVKRVKTLVEEKKTLSEEASVLKKEKEQMLVQVEKAAKRAEEAATSLEELRGQNAKTVIMRMWFDNRQCKMRDLYLGEQMRYKMMDLAVRRILDKYPHLDVSNIDLKMNLDDANEPSYFYKMDPAPQSFTYEHTLDFTYPEDADEVEEEEDGDGEEDRGEGDADETEGAEVSTEVP